jgi:NTE family protein
MAESIGLVLAGGGARGAYEIGALSVLLPWLEKQQQRPDIIVGTSIGALNGAYLAAHAHENLEHVLAEGRRRWLGVRDRNVFSPVLSPRGLATIARLGVGALLPTVVPLSLLDPAPLVQTVPDLTAVGNVHANVLAPDVPLRACAVVATEAYTDRSVVFHDGGCTPASDNRRGIDYAPTELSADHIRASAAIPAAIPGVEVLEPKDFRGWYFDGGTRLNTPIKPALKLGAGRVIVIALNSASRSRIPNGGAPPDIFDGASQIAQGLLVDPLLQDLETLAKTNEQILKSKATRVDCDDRKVVSYILVAPDGPNRVGDIAQKVFKRRYGGLRWIGRSLSLALIGRLIGASRNATRGELFSFLFFDPVFIKKLIELGRTDAERWTRNSHDHGAWQQGPLPSPPP